MCSDSRRQRPAPPSDMLKQSSTLPFLGVARHAVQVRSSNPLYSLLSWPVLFGNGRALRLRPNTTASEWPSDHAQWALFEQPRDGHEHLTGAQISHATLAVAFQPERRRVAPTGERNRDPSGWDHAALATAHTHAARPPDPYVMVLTTSPYPEARRVARPFSRVELAGRVGEEYVLDRWLCRTDQRRWMLMALQSHLRGLTMSPAERAELRELEEQEALDAEAEGRETRRGSYIPDSEVGTPSHHHKMASRALFVTHKTRRAVCFITQTLNRANVEIRSRLACFPCATADGGERVQESYERQGLHCDVFEGKRRSLEATLRSGTWARQLGRPQFDRTVDVPSGGRGATVEVDSYKLPLEVRGGGHLLGSRENQRNGTEHMHYTWAPAQAPIEWSMAAPEGAALLWADGLTCARVPDRSVLLQFHMLLPRADARALPGIAVERDAAEVHVAYRHYLDGGSPSDYVVHPDVVHDGGMAFADPNRLLRELITLVAGEGVELDGCRVRIDGAAPPVRSIALPPARSV